MTDSPRQSREKKPTESPRNDITDNPGLLEISMQTRTSTCTINRRLKLPRWSLVVRSFLFLSVCFFLRPLFPGFTATFRSFQLASAAGKCCRAIELLQGTSRRFDLDFCAVERQNDRRTAEDSLREFILLFSTVTLSVWSLSGRGCFRNVRRGARGYSEFRITLHWGK